MSRLKVLAPLAIAAATFLAFIPVLSNNFIGDDFSNLLRNRLYRGLGWTQLSWMFTTLYMGHYRPLTWMTFGFDYLLWGMNPTGYHLTSLLLHCANAVLFYFISKRLLASALPTNDDWQLTSGAAFAALMFAVHPTRAEVLSMVTDRKELLACFFFLWVVYFYLQGRTRLALGFFVLSLLSKATAITAPVLLLILDWYPLGRFREKNFALLLHEKISFALVALPFALIALIGREEQQYLISLATYGPLSRVAQALYSIGFYVWRTVVVYEIPPQFVQAPTVISIVLIGLTVVLTVLFYLLRNRWPVAWASWLWMVISLSPVVGVIQAPQAFIADRYSYAACLSLAVLVGGLLSYPLRERAKKRSERRREDSYYHPGITKIVAAAAILCVLAGSSWRQTGLWKNMTSFLTHMVESNPGQAHQFWAIFLADQADYAGAIAHMREALAIERNLGLHVSVADMHNSLGYFLTQRAQNGDLEEALKEYQTAAELDPEDATPFFNLGNVYTKRREFGKAVQKFEQALKLEPKNAKFHATLAKILSRIGREQEAESSFQKSDRD